MLYFVVVLLTILCVLFLIIFSKYKFIKISLTSYNSTLQNKNFVIVKKHTLPQHNELIVYLADDKYQISRCIALPNDTVFCSNGKFFINRKRLNDSSYAQNMYRIIYFDEEQKKFLEKKYKIIEQQDNLNLKFVSVTEKEKIEIEKYKIIVSKSQIKTKFRNSDVFPKSFRFDWNENNFGPLVLPHTQNVLILNEQTYSLWKNTITEFEKIKIERKKDNSIVINEIKSEYYTFQNNYYYVLNDQRWQLEDSRKFGPIAESCIIGKVIAFF